MVISLANQNVSTVHHQASILQGKICIGFWFLKKDLLRNRIFFKNIILFIYVSHPWSQDHNFFLAHSKNEGEETIEMDPALPSTGFSQAVASTPWLARGNYHLVIRVITSPAPHGDCGARRLTSFIFSKKMHTFRFFILNNRSKNQPWPPPSPLKYHIRNFESSLGTAHFFSQEVGGGRHLCSVSGVADSSPQPVVFAQIWLKFSNTTPKWMRVRGPLSGWGGPGFVFARYVSRLFLKITKHTGFFSNSSVSFENMAAWSAKHGGARKTIRGKILRQTLHVTRHAVLQKSWLVCAVWLFRLRAVVGLDDQPKAFPN